MPSSAASGVHVLHVVPTLTAGGLELALARVVERMGGTRHSVICMRGEAEIRDRFSPDVEIFCMRSRPNELGLPWRLAKIIRGLRPDVIHARNWGAWPDTVAARLFMWAKPPLIFSFHGVTELGRMPTRRRIAYRMLARRTALVFTVCQAAKDVLVEQIGLPAERVGVIPNGVDAEEFAPADRPAGERLVVGCAGNLTPIKNHAMLIRAFGELRSAGVDAELRLAGDGPERQRLAEQVASLGLVDRVHFLGRINDVPAFLRDLDVFCLSSDSEAHPIALLEAMACGLPCVATAVGGVPEVLADGQAGVLVAPGDDRALAGAIGELAADPSRRASLGRQARHRVCQRYSLAQMVARYGRMYSTVAAGSAVQIDELCQ